LTQPEQHGHGLGHLELVHGHHVLFDHIRALQSTLGDAPGAVGRLLGSIRGNLCIVRALTGALRRLSRRRCFGIGIRDAFLRTGEISGEAIDILCVLRDLFILFGILRLSTGYTAFDRRDGFHYVLLGSASGSREAQNQHASYCHIRFHHCEIPLSRLTFDL